MEDIIINMISESFNGFNDSVNKVIEILTRSPQSNGDMWSVTVNVYNIVLPVGLSLLTLYFVIDFLKKSMMMEYVSWEKIGSSFFKLFVCKAVLENSLKWFGLILQLVTSIITSIGTATPKFSSFDMEAIRKMVSDMGTFEQIGYLMQVAPMTFLMMLIKTFILLIVYGRMIEIYIYTALSPIPLAGLGGEATHSGAKNFIMNYAGVCLQGAVILFSCSLYSSLVKGITMNTSTSGFWDLILYSLVLLMVLAKSGSWGKKLTGGN